MKMALVQGAKDREKKASEWLGKKYKGEVGVIEGKMKEEEEKEEEGDKQEEEKQKENRVSKWNQQEKKKATRAGIVSVCLVLVSAIA